MYLPYMQLGNVNGYKNGEVSQLYKKKAGGVAIGHPEEKSIIIVAPHLKISVVVFFSE